MSESEFMAHFRASQAAHRRAAAEREVADTALWAPLPPHNGTETSIAAADAIAGEMGRLELLVLRCVIGLANATTEEIEEALSLSGNTVRPRIWTLRQKGFVRDIEGTRRTKSGRQAQVHCATPEGLAAALEANAGHRRRAA